MNAKTTKMLAVLAVLAMAFAVFAVIAPAQQDDAAATTGTSFDITDADNNITKYVAGTTTIENGKGYYITSDVTIDIPADSSTHVMLFIDKGVNVTLKSSTGTAYAFAGFVNVKSFTDSKTVSFETLNYFAPDSGAIDWSKDSSGNDVTTVGAGLVWGQKAMSWQKGDSFTVTASSTGSGFSINGGSVNFDAYGATTLTGSFGTITYKADVTITFSNVTAKVKSNADGAQVFTLTKFSGKISVANGVATITAWTAGDIDVETASSDVKIGADIPAGSTLYIDGGASVTTDSAIAHTVASRTDTTKFYNDGTISLKQKTTTQNAISTTTYGQFTVSCANGMENNGSINNLGKFIHNALVIVNNGKITTGHDESGIAWTGQAGTVTNKGTFTFKETSVALTTNIFNKASTGDIINKNENVVYLSGIVENNNTFGVNQTVIVTGNTTIKGINLINGAFIVDEDATLTIVAGGSIVLSSVQATLTNNGNIVVQSTGAVGAAVADQGAIVAGKTANTGGFIQNNGTITLTDPAGLTGKTFSVGSAAVAFLKNAGTIINSQGTMEIGANAFFMNLKGAAFYENNILDLGDGAIISNAGAMSFDGKVKLAATTTTITIDDKSAMITIVSLNLSETGKKLVIQNDVKSVAGSYTHYKIEFDTTKVGTAPAEHVLSGLTIGTYNIPDIDAKKVKTDNYGYFYLEGNVSFYTATYAKALAAYKVTLSDTAVIGNLTIQEDVKLEASGDNSEFKFIGTASIIDPNSASIAGLKTAAVTGEVIVNKAQLSLPAEGSKINAAMYMVTVGFDKIYHYTTLDNAVAEASAAGITEIIVTGEVEVDKDVEIPAGLKVVNKAAPLTIDDGATITVKDGAELNNLGTVTVKGALYAEDAADITGNTTDSAIISDVKVVGEPDVLFTNLYDALETAEAGDVVVITKNDGSAVTLAKNTTIKEGVVLDTNEKELKTDKYTLTVNGALTLYGGATFETWSKVVLNGYIISDTELTYTTTGVPGAYFYDEEDDVYCIAGVKNLGDILEEGIATVNVWGDVKTASLSFEGTVTGTTVTFNNNVDVDAIIADNVKIVFKAGDVIDTAITEGENILGLTGIVSATEDMTVTIGDSFAVAGDLTTGTAVPAKDFVFNIVGAIKVSGSVYAAVIVGEATTSGAFNVETTIDILGSLVASKEVKANDMSVIGTVSTSGTSGSIAIANGLNIGSLTEIIAAGADVEGAVTAKSIILFVGNTIDEKIVAEMKSTEVYVDGELWFTVYSDSAVTIDKETELVVPVEDALAVAGTYGGLVVDKNGIISGTVTPGTPAEIDIEVTYEIYSVVILTDAGVKSVSIDGIELWNSGTNKFELPTGVKLMAGTHAVTFTMKAGYSGTPTLKTVDGTILKDNKFVTSGIEDLTVQLQLNGTEPTPEPEPTPTPEEKSEWTITTILLVILVILIAVMAVIVALRLNRN